MESGLILLVIIVLVAIILGGAFYVLSWAGKTSPKGDRIEGPNAADASAERPQHMQVDTNSPVTDVGTDE